IRLSQQHSCSFDHLVGAAEHGQRDCDAERLGGLEVQEQFNFRDLWFHLLLGRVYDDKDVQERIVRRSKLRPASIGLPKNGDDGRVGEARRITFAVINVTDNVRGELSAHVITASELNRQKIARAIERDAHDAESVGIIDTTDVRRDHSLYLTVAKDISSPQARTKSARYPILKCAARSIRLIRYRPAAPPAPRNRIRANADNRKASRPSLSNAVLFHSDHRRDLPLGRQSRLTTSENGQPSC